MDNEIIFLCVCIVLVLWYIYYGDNCMCKKKHRYDYFTGSESEVNLSPPVFESDPMYFPRERDCSTGFDGTTPDGFIVPYMTAHEKSMAAINKPMQKISYIGETKFGKYF